MNKNKPSKRKAFIKSTLIVLAPLIVVALAFGIGSIYSSYTMQTQRAEMRIRTHENILYDFDYLLRALEDNLPTLGILYRQNGVDLMALGRDIQYTLENPTEYIYFMQFWRILGSDFLGPIGPAYPTSHLSRIS